MKLIQNMNDFDEINVGSLILLQKACLIPITTISFFPNRKEHDIFNRYIMVIKSRKEYFPTTRSMLNSCNVVVAMQVLVEQMIVITFTKINSSPHIQSSCNGYGYEVELFLI